MKTCKRCNNQFDNKTCPVCKKIYDQNWKKNNHQKIIQYNKKYAEKNKEKKKKQDAEYYQKNKEKKRFSQRENKRKNEQNRRAIKKNAKGKLSNGIVEKLLVLQKFKCPICTANLKENKYHLDHIMPLALGGSNTDDNAQILCQPCNNEKYSKHPVDFMQSKGFLL